MRTTFFTVALCAATAIAAPHRRPHLSKVVDTVESEVSDLESSLTKRHVPRPGKKLVKEVESEVSDIVSRGNNWHVVDEVEDEVDSLTSSLGVRAPLDTTSTVIQVENEVDSLVDTSSLGVRPPLDASSTVTEVESELDSLVDTSSLGVRAPLDAEGTLTSTVAEVETEVESLTGVEASELNVRDDTALLDKVVKQVDNIMDLHIPSKDKLQRILNTIVGEIQARDAVEKRTLSLPTSLSGLDLSALDDASVDELIDDLGALLERLVQLVDPSEVSDVQQGIDDLKDLLAELENDAGLSKRDLVGLDLPVIDSLDLSSLMADVETMCACITRAMMREVKTISPSLAKEMKSLNREVMSIVTDLESSL